MNVLLQKILSNKWVWIVFGIAVIVYGFYYFYTQNEDLKRQLDLAKGNLAQNTAAFQDSLHKKADSIQVMAVSIYDLNIKNDSLKHDKLILSTTVQALAESLRLSGHSLAVSGMDSIGQYVTVSFTTQQSIAHISGETKAYLTPLSAMKSTWRVNADFDPAYARINFGFNDSLRLFEITTTSMTPGLKLIAYSVLDKDSYGYLYENQKVIATAHKPELFWVGGTIDRYSVNTGILLNFNPWIFIGNYRLFSKDAEANLSWYNELQVGAYHVIF